MPRIISAVGIVLSLILLDIVPTQAADLEAKAGRHTVTASRQALAAPHDSATPQPTCSWVGARRPGHLQMQMSRLQICKRIGLNHQHALDKKRFVIVASAAVANEYSPGMRLRV
jgi:hypothetical protein